MHRMNLHLGLLFGLLCLGGCGVAQAQHARGRELVDIAACQGTYPEVKGSLVLLMRCEDAAARAYANRVAPADVGAFDRYAQAVERDALAVDRGRMTMGAWLILVSHERYAVKPPRDRRMQSLVAALPAAQSPT